MRICDCDREQGCITNAHYRFMVVWRKYYSNPNPRQIFSSETSDWCNSVVSTPRKLNLNPFMPISCQAGVIACNGMLHWVWVEDEEIKGFVVFDPFNDSEQCHYIHPPIELPPRQCLFWRTFTWTSFGVFRGRLQIFRFSHYPHNFNAGSFSFWKLEDYITVMQVHGAWNKKFTSATWFSKIMLTILREMLYEDTTFLAFHPNDGDIVFLRCISILLCDLRTGVLKRFYYSYHIPVRSKLIQLVQPSWPTPVPPLPLNAPSISNSKWDFLSSRDYF